MASTMQTFPKMLKILRENGTPKEKREALTYIQSLCKRTDFSGTIKEEECKELCKLVIGLFTTEDNNIEQEASDTLRVMIQDLKNHTLNIFESIMQTSRRTRLKFFKLLEGVEDSAIAAAAHDKAMLNFFNDCFGSVQSTTMKWLAPVTGTENIKMLTDIENQSLSDEEKMEEDIVNCAVALLQRLYKVATLTLDSKIQRFNTLVMDKVVMLAYMGHKRQRTPALRVLQQVILTNLPTQIRTEFPSVWSSYKAALLSAYYKRMLLLADACELDWSKQWNISIQFLGTDLHRGSVLINNLLSVEERAFKSTDTIIRRQAFLSWKLLIDNFALNPAELATTRRIKLLCIPLNAKNSKTEMIALTKLEVWWHLIIKVYKDIAQFANLIITQYLNFCFGPLGDTPLLSSKCDVVASPGKRFFKTKLVAVDALCQLLIPKKDIQPLFSPIMDERLPHCISDAVFQECYQSIIHSVGEALLILAQLTDKELKNRYQISKLLWTNLIYYVQQSKMETKNSLYKNIFMIITELGNHMKDKATIRDLILDCILEEITEIVKQCDYSDTSLFDLILKLLTPGLINDMKTNHCEAIKCLLWQYIKPKKAVMYRPDTLQVFNTLLEKLQPLSKDLKNISAFSELWCAIAQILTKFVEDSQNINEGSAAEHQFTTVVQVLSFPFKYIFFDDARELQETAKTWKNLYKQFDIQADSIATVKPNEVLLSTASTMKQCYNENNKCFSLIVSCLDALLSTINYKHLLDEGDTTIIQFIVDLTLNAFTNEQSSICEMILKALSALLITVYGLDTEKVVTYLQVSKPVIEVMLLSKSDLLMKEIVNTWETVVSIFKGLNKYLNRDLLNLYKYTIIRAISHANMDIKTQALSILEVIDNLDENVKNSTKDVVTEIMTEIKENECIIKSQYVTNTAEKGQKIVHQVKASGSFLNRKPASPTPTTKKQKGKDEKKVVLPPDPSSQDYVFIKTDLKFDVNRLTEHQKESFKRRRDDIPALYNDLSQSCSQDSQGLQEMFNRKINKAVNVLEEETVEQKENDKPNCDLDKDKKTVTVECANNEKQESTKIDVHVEKKEEKADQELESQESLNSTKETHYSPAEKLSETTENDAKTGAKDTDDKDSLQPETVAVRAPSVTGSLSPEEEIAGSQDTVSEPVPKKLNFESREEFPDDKEQGRSSPSVFDNDKRRSRNVGKISVDGKQEGTSPKQDRTDAKVVRTLRRNARQTKTDGKDKFTDENRRGLKRKCASDSDSEGSIQPRRRRKLGNSGSEVHSDSDSTKSSEVENITSILDGIVDKKSLSQRTKNEISRLRIDMVFDCPPNRRRSKTDPNAKDQPASEGKASKAKASEGKAVETARRRSKVLDKETDVSPTNKKQRKRNAKVDSTKSTDKLENNDTTEDKVKSVEDKGNGDVEDSKEKSAASSEHDEKMIMDTETEKPDLEKSKKSITETVPEDNVEKQEESNTETQNTEADIETPSNIEESTQSQDQDFVESSQESVPAKFDKKCNERQCFIKIDKLDNILSKPQEPVVVNEVVVETTEVKSDLIEDSQEEKISDEKDDATPPVQEDEDDTEENNAQQPDNTLNDNANVKTENGKGVSIENPKSDGSPLKPSSISSFSSPKSNNSKRFWSLQFPNQGRGAHMLGLVTKQALLENDGIKMDEEVAPKKSKAKESDYEPLPIRKDKVLPQKDSETGIRTATSGSRQEKIFNNMRSADYLSSPPVKLFSNLKNDGEKISPKMDRHLSDSASTHGIDKENDGNASPPCEREELPMLEWSSANPPSLTASPSASILKRQRSSVIEQEQESITPSKRKRVSFADPPVSKEMGYEIVSAGSPQKVNKLTTRGSPFRKDSLLKLKKIRRELLVPVFPTWEDENSSTLNLSEVQLQCERENEILTKIAEELEFPEPTAMNVDNEMPSTSTGLEKDDILETAVNANKVTITNLSMEVEIAEEKQETDLSVTEKSEDNDQDSAVDETKDVDMQDSETQQDIFSDVDGKENENSQTSEQDRSVIPDSLIESPELNSIDSGKDVSSKDESKTDTLEDTVDVANLTELNSTASSDGGFCKPLRSSTQRTDNAEELDTLSIPGTNLATQDTQNVSQVTAEISKPELLDSTTSIYPSLISRKEPISAIIGDLTNPLWVQYLTTYFGDRGLRTIGDLARLSEREVDRFPVKGSPKIDFVKKILRRFENSLPTAARTTLEEKSNGTNFCGIASASTVFSVSEQNQTMPRPEDSELTCSTPLSRACSMASKMCNIDAASATVSVAALNDTAESTTTDVSAGTPFMAPRTPQGPPTGMCRTSTVSASAMNFSTSTTNQPICRPISSARSLELLNNSTEVSTASESAFNPAMQTTVSIGTETDFISPTRISTKTVSKSVASQLALDELLDEIDVKLVLESAVKRCSAEKLLTGFKEKLKHMPEAELITETIRMLDVEGKPNYDELTLKSACRACGVNKVLLRLPDIFGGDKEFFTKVLNAYRKKITPSDCLNVLDIDELKDAFCQKCTSTDLAQMLTRTLKDEEEHGINTPMTELSSLGAMLRRIPREALINNIVSNEELIPAKIVMDIALRSNSLHNIAEALSAQPSIVRKTVFDKLWSPQEAVSRIEAENMPKEDLLDIFRAVSSKLSDKDLLDAYHSAMKTKLDEKMDDTQDVSLS